MIVEVWGKEGELVAFVKPEEEHSIGNSYEKLFEIEGNNWNDCMIKYHEKMEWQPYIPMEDYTKEEFDEGYKEYCCLPLAGFGNFESELYNNMWVRVTGRGVVHPDPHRHYTRDEFEREIYRKPELEKRFLKKD